MYKRIDLCEVRLKEIHNGDFELLRITPNVTAKGKKVSRLTEYISEMGYMPSKQSRYCTDRFKIQPIERFLKQQGECELMIGFNADEDPGVDRVGNFEKLKSVKYSYPLFNDGYDREMCEDILNLYGLHPDFPVYMKRGGCVGCIFKSVSEYKAMYFFSREEFDSNMALEEGVQDKRKKFFTLSMSQHSFRQIKQICENELNMWGIDAVHEMYKKVKSTQSCGPFCHR